MDHLALNVGTLRQLKQVQKKLRDAGLTVSEIQDLAGSPFVKSIYFYDPNGIPLEIATWDRSVRSKAKRLSDPSPVAAMTERKRVVAKKKAAASPKRTAA